MALKWRKVALRIAQAAGPQKWTHLPFAQSPALDFQCSISAEKVKSIFSLPAPRKPDSSAPAGHRARLPLQISAGALLLLAALLFGMGACARRGDPPPDPLAPHRAAMKDAYRGDVDLAAAAPRYQISITLPPPANVLTGTARIDLTNNSSDPWSHLVFRLYPMLDQYRGRMTLLSALINDSPTNFVYQTQSTAVRVNMPRALLPGQTATVELSWKLTIPKWSDDSATYALFGASQEMISLPLFYPALAVYEPGPAIGTGNWWLETGSVRGDAAFNQASLFVVTATLPSDQAPVATGTRIITHDVGEGLTQHIWATGPVREFLLHMSPRFESASTEAYGTRVTSYWLPGDESAGRAALAYAVAALRFYSDYFGSYPARDMAVAPAALSYRGMEYPQVSLLGVQLYSRYRADLETLVAHEAAHHWWFQIVHNDPVREPWLDEALAEYAMRLYFEAVYGEERAAAVEQQRWRVPLSLLAERNADVNVNRPVDAFESGSQYETIIYAKGALFYAQLRESLGDREFRDFLRSYLGRYRYQIVSTEDWLAELRSLDNPELLTLYREWVQPPSARPVMEPTPTDAPEAQAVAP